MLRAFSPPRLLFGAADVIDHRHASAVSVLFLAAEFTAIERFDRSLSLLGHLFVPSFINSSMTFLSLSAGAFNAGAPLLLRGALSHFLFREWRWRQQVAVIA